MYKNILVLSFLILSFNELLADRMPFFDNPYNDKAKFQYSNELKVYFSKLNNQIISLSPKEEKWLKKELEKSGKIVNTQYFELIRSREYAIYKSSRYLAGILESIETIHLGIYTNRISQEMLGWSTLIEQLHDLGSWGYLRQLVIDGTIDKELLKKDDSSIVIYLNNGHLGANYIQSYIISGYFVNEFVQETSSK